MTDRCFHPAVRSALEDSLRLAPDLQPWSDYFKLRGIELSHLLHAMERDDGEHPLAPIGRVLDIGPGIGFSTLVWKQLSQEVVAVDLLRHNPPVHALGVDVARLYLARMRSSNGAGVLRWVSGRAEALPLKAESVDVTFSAYALQYTAPRRVAFSEIHRVLRPAGRLFVFLPTAWERVLVWAEHYPALASRVFLRSVIRSTAAAHPPKEGESRSKAPSSLWTRVRNNWKPRPDHPYSTHWQQLKGQRLACWLHEMHAAGFRVKTLIALRHGEGLLSEVRRRAYCLVIASKR